MSNQSTTASNEGTWNTTLLALSGMSTMLGNLYSSLLAIYEQPSGASHLYPWFNKLDQNQQNKILTIIYDITYKEIPPLGNMVKKGLLQIQSGNPPNIIAPPYQVPPWKLSTNSHSILKDLWVAIKLSLVLFLSNQDFSQHPILKAILLALLMNIEQYIDTIIDIFEI
jgi:hypothetical protein